jgi:hypothetical protein
MGERMGFPAKNPPQNPFPSVNPQNPFSYGIRMGNLFFRCNETSQKKSKIKIIALQPSPFQGKN